MTGEWTVTAQLPAICRQCGTVFESAYRVNDETKAHMSGCTSGPCPVCGSVADIPDGLWTLVPRVLSLAREARPALADLTSLRDLIDEQFQSTFDLDLLTARAEREAPTAAPLLSVMRDPATQSVLGVLSLLVAIAALIVSLGGSAPEQQPGNDPQHQHQRSHSHQRPPDIKHHTQRDPEGGKE